MKLAIMIFTATALLSIMSAAIKFVQKTENSYLEKTSQFECGFNSMSPSHIPFSFQFFLVAILFLIFDVEISMVLSYPLESKSTMNTNVILVFLLILLIGLIYEWKKGKIDWTKWMKHLPCKKVPATQLQPST